MDILIFCEWLIHRAVFEDDYAADMTLNGIIHFLYIARQKALQDSDMDDYRNHKNLVDKINLMRDTARNEKNAQKLLSVQF